MNIDAIYIAQSKKNKNDMMYAAEFLSDLKVRKYRNTSFWYWHNATER